MNKEQFLEQTDVSNFIAWLKHNLPTISIQLRIRKSRFNPVAINLDVQGLASVLPHYAWKSSWTDEAGKNVESCDWETTRVSLERLADYLRSAIGRHDDHATLAACLQILKWGGVRGAVAFLKQQAGANTLTEYLMSRQPFFELNGNQNFGEIDAALIHRFDAGMTKIHSLLDSSGSPIYDSRVGAAMAMLYQLYHGQHGEQALRFPSGAARGSQIRNPGALGYESAPQFYTRDVSPHEWAQYQVKLGWIIWELAHQNWFSGEVHEQCRALEGCLFMVGYDLRALVPAEDFAGAIPKNGAPVVERTKAVPSGNILTWVPTSHPFKKVLNHLLEFRKANIGGVADRAAFIDWLIKEYQFARNTAKSYCFPFGENEFDLWDRSVEELEVIARGGKEALSCVLEDREIEVDERAWVCLNDARIVGELRKLDLKQADMEDLILEKKFAGTKNTAKLLITVGNQVGKHFDLLGDDGKATPLFYEIFGEEGLCAFRGT